MIRLFASTTLEAYALLTRVIIEGYGFPTLPELLRTETGKPYFEYASAPHFNLSHSGGYVLCGVGDRPLGVDIEVVRPRKAGLPGYCLTEREQFMFWDRGGRWEDFYELWTRREAWSKYTGAGVARSRGTDIPANLCLSTYEGPGWRASVCAEEEAGELIWVTGQKISPIS